LVDDQETKIAVLIAAFDTEHKRVQGAIAALNQTGEKLQREVRAAAAGAVDEALAHLNPEIKKAAQTLVDLQRLSLWRAAWQHAVVALVAMAIALLAVWWYVPPMSEITALRTERDQLTASIENLSQRGARMTHSLCGTGGEPKRFCVLVPKRPLQWGSRDNPNEVYVVPIGY
jgi:hypothetical protein